MLFLESLQQLKILMLDMTIDHLGMDWFKDKLMLLKTMILIHIFSGGPARGRVDEGAGEVEGNHRGAGADLRRDVRILDFGLDPGHSLFLIFSN